MRDFSGFCEHLFGTDTGGCNPSQTGETSKSAVRDLYFERFITEVNISYKNDPSPLGSVFLPEFKGYPDPFSPDEMNDIYRRCLIGNTLWQDIPEIREKVLNEYRKYNEYWTNSGRPLL